MDLSVSSLGGENEANLNHHELRDSDGCLSMGLEASRIHFTNPDRVGLYKL